MVNLLPSLGLRDCFVIGEFHAWWCWELTAIFCTLCPTLDVQILAKNIFCYVFHLQDSHCQCQNVKPSWDVDDGGGSGDSQNPMTCKAPVRPPLPALQYFLTDAVNLTEQW